MARTFFLNLCGVSFLLFNGCGKITGDDTLEKGEVSTLNDSVGGEHGNGGDVIVCPKDDGTKTFELLDYFEAKELFGRNLKNAPDAADDFESAVLIAKQLSRINSLRSKALINEIANVKAKMRLLPSANLVDIRDEHQIAFQANCILTQAAIKHTVNGTTSFYFDNDIWQHLDRTQRVGLILHEALHAEFYDLTNRSSTMTRRFNGLLADDDLKLETVELQTYVDELRRIGVTWFEYHGWPFLIEDTTFGDDSAFGRLAPIEISIPIKNSIDSAVRVRANLISTFDPIDPMKLENPSLKDIIADQIAFARNVTIKSNGNPTYPIVIDSAEGTRGPPSQLPSGLANCGAPTLTPETRANPRIKLGDVLVPVAKSCTLVIGDGYLWNGLFLPKAYGLQNHPEFKVPNKTYDLTLDFDSEQLFFNLVPESYYAGIPSKEVICEPCSGQLNLGTAAVKVHKTNVLGLPDVRAVGFTVHANGPLPVLKLPGGQVATLAPGEVMANFDGFLLKGTLDNSATVKMPNFFSAAGAVAKGALHLVYSPDDSSRLRGLRLVLASDAELAERVNGKRVIIRAGCSIEGLLQQDYPDTRTFIPEYSDLDDQGRACVYQR